MSNDSEKPSLFSQLFGDDPELWSILPELAKYDELTLRVILRPHDEGSLSWRRDSEIIELRARLDRALSVLTYLEIGYETGVFPWAQESVPRIESLRKLFQSESLLNYASAYLYFAIRFLAYRVSPPVWIEGTASEKLLQFKTNKRSFPLVTPPTFCSNAAIKTQFEEMVVSLKPKPNITDALNFLDGFYTSSEEPQKYELWLRGLRPETNPGPVGRGEGEIKGRRENDTRLGTTPEESARFQIISSGLTEWALSRSNFYLSLQTADTLPVSTTESKGLVEEEGGTRPLGGWIVVNPVAPRFALADLYWIARLLRADVSAAASVTYSHTSWLHLLGFQAALQRDDAREVALRKAEEVLRSVFDFVCDLTQNAIALSVEKQRRFFDPQDFTNPPRKTMHWLDVFDEELELIVQQRFQRRFRDITGAPGDRDTAHPFGVLCSSGKGWSERLKSGKKPHNLIGLAFSGGGIRSATFNLGVLQGLQEFDQLRYVDYLSTVSGGGFIGAWLVGNVKRSQHWLSRRTCWDESIAYLRAYSNYLAPRTGVLSADTWTMFASWVRNAFLIQLTGFSWLLVLLLGVLICRWGFLQAVDLTASAGHRQYLPEGTVFVMAVLVTCTLVYNFTKRVDTGKGALGTRWIRYLAVVPSWFGALLVAARLWSNAAFDKWSTCFRSWNTYSQILEHGWHPWCLLLSTYWMALLITASVSLSTCAVATLPVGAMPKNKRDVILLAILRAFWISTLCLIVLYLGLSSILYLFLKWTTDPNRFGSYAFVFGPSLVLDAFTLSIVLFIGLSGRNSNEAQREWWTRFGTWLAIYAGIALVLSCFAIFGPRLMVLLFTLDSAHHDAIKWGTVLSWAGTVIAGLFSGKSSKTSGDGTKAPLLEILAKVGGFLFIIGGVVVTATVLYLFLLNFGTSFDFKIHELKTNYWTVLCAIEFSTLAETLLVVIGCALLFSWFFEINIFGLNQFYRNRLVRCYLGATRWAPGVRRPHPFTKFDFNDDLSLGDMGKGFRGPFPILSCALNLTGSSDLALHTRHSASFSLTPLRCGADRPKVGYAPTDSGIDRFADGVRLGQAVAISGAAASPNMGYNTSPLVAFLLTMFNVRLGWWFPNPGQYAWNRRGMRYSLYYLTKELFGIADETRLFLNVSDGGHFENLGIYELVRRRCKVIIASDAECDEALQFGGLGNVIRLCETDFGAVIDIDIKSIRQQKESDSLAHCTVGQIKYSNGSIGYLLYMKASITGDEDVSVTQYRSTHPTFPHETTANQFFSEDQFESYRKLGQHIVRHALRGHQPGDNPVMVAERLADVLAPAGCNPEAYLKHNRTLAEIWERFRYAGYPNPLVSELLGMTAPANLVPNPDEICLALELLQLMEDVFMDLRLDDFWEHPDNRGWAMLFMGCARSPRFRRVWAETNRTFGIRFEYFCDARLGLTRDRPIVRV